LAAVITQTGLEGLILHARGKVRDIYDLDANRLLFVASDRISAFDCVLPTGIPDKGKVLTQLSLFWFNFLREIVPNHVITADVREYPDTLLPYLDQLEGRSMIVTKAQMVGVECVVRGYLSGSGWKDYQRTGSICGISLPGGLRESDKLPEPIFTPAIKNNAGHDENIPFSEMEKIAGPEMARKLRDLSMRIYQAAAEYARTRGVILADSKFEFGTTLAGIVLADEVFTPDSSRFWPAGSYEPGKAQVSYDKQFVRDYLESIHWDKQPPAPPLPADVVRKTSEKYKQAYRELTGKELRA
jgi:phosphoribosylaminoimidazole-succinocarboxamide synthase